jgi:hypothetical protein
MHSALLRLTLVIALLAGACEVASACSLARSYEPFRLRSTIRHAETNDPAPEVHVEEIKRGRSGDATACANWGSVLIGVPAGDVGYSFEPIEGSVSRIAFPVGYVQSIRGYARPAYLRFYWDDGATDDQEPIEIFVRVTAMSRDGVLSEPMVLRIEDPGVSAAR